MILRAVLICAFAACCFLGIQEVRRWDAQPGLLSRRQRRLRAGSLFFLLVILGMCFGGTFLPNPAGPVSRLTHAQKAVKLRWLGYWAATAVMVLPLVTLALLDMKEMARGHDFLRVGVSGLSTDANLIEYTLDLSVVRDYSVQIRVLESVRDDSWWVTQVSSGECVADRSTI